MADQNVVDRLDFASDTDNCADKCNLSLARYALAGIWDPTYGWVGGGVGGGAVKDVVDAITFASDTDNAADKCNLSTGRAYLAAVGNVTYGYFGGGSTAVGGGGPVNIVDVFTMADDTVNCADKCDLVGALAYLSGISSGTYGYFAGGAAVDTIQSIEFASDTTNAADKANLSAAAQDCAGGRGTG